MKPKQKLWAMNDARIPNGDTMAIDFNKVYNPYCAYNDKCSCPIVPLVNYLRIRVEAGVKAFWKQILNSHKGFCVTEKGFHEALFKSKNV